MNDSNRARLLRDVPPDSEPVREASYDVESESDVLTTIVDVLAGANGVDPLELEPPLAAAVDTEALERIFSPTGAGQSRSSGAASFRFGDHVVLVDWEREQVSVYDASSDSRRSVHN